MYYPSVLAVQFISLSAQQKNENVLLSWSVATETNTDYYTVQRSIDAVNFTDIATINSKGTGAGINSYSYSDQNVFSLNSKNLYYRVQETDKDNKDVYSNVVPIAIQEHNITVSLMPNPVNNVLNILINNYSGEAQIILYDINGKKIKQFNNPVISNKNLQLPVNYLKPGAYLLNVKLNEASYSLRFLKQ
jgi:hypothetical protein